MKLCRIVEVPDPDGTLVDLLDELLDNSVLVPVVIDYEAARNVLWKRARISRGSDDQITAHLVVDAALGDGP